MRNKRFKGETRILHPFVSLIKKNKNFYLLNNKDASI